MHPRCHQSPPGFARPFGEVQRQFLRGWWLPGRADRRQGHAPRAPDSELTTSVPGPRTRVPPHWASSEEAVMQYALPLVLPDVAAGGVWARVDRAPPRPVARVAG